MTQPIKTPGPDHPITLTYEPERVRVMFHGHLLGESDRAVTLREAGYKPVRYFPREDIRDEFLRRTQRTSECPYKGRASYFTLYRDGQILEDAVWSYEEPYPAVAQIAGRLAFFPGTVDFEVERMEGDAQRQAVDEAVQHTDSGAGSSQEPPWPSNVSGPAEDSQPPYQGTGAI